MAKFTKIYENETITSILVFRGQEFTETMNPNYEGQTGRKGSKCFEYLLQEAFEEDPDIEEISEAGSELTFGDDDEVEDALMVLSMYEK